jgi:hypothetical protein
MIEFDPDKSIPSIVDQKKVENKQRTGKNEFQEIFQQAVDSVKTENTNVESTPYISEIRPVQFETQAESSTSQIVDQVDALLHSMEDYQQVLMNRDATLKDIEPIIDRIGKQSASLSGISQDMGLDDDLKSLVNQSLSLSLQEIARYKSGHYNDD